MIKLLTEDPFQELEKFLNTNLESRVHSLENILELGQLQISKHIDELFTINSKENFSKEIIQEATLENVNLLLLKNTYAMDSLLITFWKKKRQLALAHYNKAKNQPKDLLHYKNVLKTMTWDAELDISTLNIKDNTNQSEVYLFLEVLKGKFSDFYEAMAAKVFSDVLDSLHSATGSNQRIYTNFTQVQLGLLSKVISETRDHDFGFTNLKKSQIDELFFSVMHTQKGPIDNAKNLNKVTFGSTENIEKDIEVLNSYFVALQKKLLDLKKSGS